VAGTTPGGWVRWTTLIEPRAGGRCEVRVSLEYELPGEIVTSLFGVLVGGRLEREVVRTYRNLRELAEREARDAELAAVAAGETGPAEVDGDVELHAVG
jgi:hypothetical protein